MSETYLSTRQQLETYFDKTASKTWERLTSDAPVSGIRQTVRAGRNQMRAALLAALPEDLRGARVLDAGCGAGEMVIELAKRGAVVRAVDISPSLLAVAEKRLPEAYKHQVQFRAGDMLSADHGPVDFVVAMDSVIHYRPADIAVALSRLAGLADEKVVFTVAPKTLPLTCMHLAGKLFPRRDRSPAIIPISETALRRACSDLPVLDAWRLTAGQRVAKGFYISQAMELRRCS